MPNILLILQADNVFREITQVYRYYNNLGQDVQDGLVNRNFIVARDLRLQIQSLNLVRKILDNSIILSDYITEIKAAGTKVLDVLFWGLDNVLEKATVANKKQISHYLLYFMNTADGRICFNMDFCFICIILRIGQNIFK